MWSRVPRGVWEAMGGAAGAHLGERSGSSSAAVDGSGHGDGLTDRRGVLKHGALLAAGAVAGGAALVAARAGPAAAVNGTSVKAGSKTTAETVTNVTTDGTTDYGGIVLLGNDSTYNGKGVKYPAAVGGLGRLRHHRRRHGGVANGVYGHTVSLPRGSAWSGTTPPESVSSTGAGVLGVSGSNTSVGVMGTNTDGPGVQGISDTDNGVYGFSSHIGVMGNSDSGYGVYALSTTGTPLRAESDSSAESVHAILAVLNNPSGGLGSSVVDVQNESTGLGDGVTPRTSSGSGNAISGHQRDWPRGRRPGDQRRELGQCRVRDDGRDRAGGRGSGHQRGQHQPRRLRPDQRQRLGRLRADHELGEQRAGGHRPDQRHRERRGRGGDRFGSRGQRPGLRDRLGARPGGSSTRPTPSPA